MPYGDSLTPASTLPAYRHIPCTDSVFSFRQAPEQLQISGFSGASELEGTRLRGVADAEGVGLVSFKTRANLTTRANLPLGENEGFEISFSKEATTEKRCKRLKSAVWASGHLHGIAKCGFRPLQAWFVTLTYALADAWQPRHIKRAVDAFRRWCVRQGIDAKYTWVSEIQPKRLASTGRAVVHYHLMCWLPVGVVMPKWDVPQITKSGQNRDAFWPHGMTNTQRAKAGIGYLMKYLSKIGELTVFPDGLRLYGIGGLDGAARVVRAWYGLPNWVRCTYGVGDVRRVAGGLVDMSTGELLPPMFSRQLMPGGMRLTCLRPYPERFADGAFSTFPRVL